MTYAFYIVNAMATDTTMLEFSNTTDLIPQTYMALEC